MGELFEKLGIDWRLFIAQLVNFLIFAGILTKLLWRPITKLLSEREEKIKKGLADAETAAQKLVASEKEVQALLDRARMEASQIAVKAEQDAQARSQAMLSHTQEEAKMIVAKAKQEIVFEQTQAVQAAKAQLGSLVTSALERILGRVETREIDTKLIEEAVTIMKRS